MGKWDQWPRCKQSAKAPKWKACGILKTLLWPSAQVPLIITWLWTYLGCISWTMPLTAFNICKIFTNVYASGWWISALHQATNNLEISNIECGSGGMVAVRNFDLSTSFRGLAITLHLRKIWIYIYMWYILVPTSTIHCTIHCYRRRSCTNSYRQVYR